MCPLSFHVVLSVFVTGCLSVSWDMKVSPVVSVLRGQDAVLSCSFTHPRQQDYSGTVTVKWLARGRRAEPFFTCSVKNVSADGLGDCSSPGLRHSLTGDPRRGDLSLLVRTARLDDNGTFFCRVELDGYWSGSFQKETQLYVTVKPQILSLSVVEVSSGPDAPPRLQCEVEGHPLPSVTWRSGSGGPVGPALTSGAGPYRLLSSVPYLGGGLTCRAESRLGAAESTYPPDKTLTVALSVSGLGVLLSAGLVCCRRRRAAARVDTSPVYGNVEEAEGAAELQLVYSALTVTSPAGGETFRADQHVSIRSSTGRQEDTGEPTGVVYSAVNVQ